VLGDVNYTALEADESVAATEVEIDSSLAWISLGAGYTLDCEPGRSVDLYAGARYTELNNDAQASGGVNASSTSNQSWLDPLLGFDARMVLSDRFQLGLLANVGGFGVGSDLTYEILPRANYRLGRCCSLVLGYRWLDTDFEDDEFEYDVSEYGWIAGLGFKL